MILPLIPIVLVLLLRFVLLDARPLHHDESVNGWFVDGVFSKGFYSYDPQNYHGPLYFYILAIFEKVFGRSVTVLRIPPVLFGSLLSLSPLWFRTWIGDRTAWIATLFLAISPALVFYSRYSIHETGFALLCIVFFRLWLEIREGGWNRRRLILLALVTGLMASMKENFVIFGAALGFAEILVSVLEAKATLPLRKDFWLKVLGCLGLSMIPIVFIYTGFFRDGEGVSKFFAAFLRWSETGSNGNGHQKPFWYWLELTGTYEWLALAGLILTPFSLVKVSRPMRLIGVLGGVLWLIYSVVSYKTPWCMLSFYWFPVVFGAAWIDRALASRYKSVLAAALMAGGGISIYQAYDVSWARPDQDGHPYIYGQTYAAFVEPVNAILERVKAEPELKNKLRIQVVSDFTWPLPYLLGEIKQTGYYSKASAPQVLDADVVICDEAFVEEMSNRLRGMYIRQVVPSRQWASKSVFMFKQMDFPRPPGSR
ncbi:MAG: TIGR03663 family protein [Proteobacteria bacterium]|nr:TIGR03663 family protein [Pseudomonadota bacterium]